MNCICPFCRSNNVTTAKSPSGKFYAECSCGARGSFKSSEEDALNSFNLKTDLEQFKAMLMKSEFSHYFSETDGSINYAGVECDTRDLGLIKTADGTKVNAVFSKSTEDLLGVLLECE